MSTAPSPSGLREPEPAANGKGKRRAWLGFFVEEWGLLLLAATMTFGSWWSVREQVVKEFQIDKITVALKVDSRVEDRIGAVWTGEDATISITLSCSQRERNEAFQRLKRTGIAQVTLRIRQEPAGEDRGYVAKADIFEWPFDAARILKTTFKDGELPIRVFKTVQGRAHVGDPQTERSAEALRLEEKLQVEFDLPDKSFPITGPEVIFDLPITPDKIAIDPSEFPLREDGTYGGTRSVVLTFREWRKTGAEGWIQAYKRGVPLPEVKATVRLIPLEEPSISNRLVVLADESLYEFDFEELRSDPSVARVGPLTSQGTLRGPKEVLDELKQEASKNQWLWAIRLKSDPEAEFKSGGVEPDAEGWLSLNGEIIWLPFERFQNRGVVHVRQALEKEFTYRVRLRKKP